METPPPTFPPQQPVGEVARRRLTEEERKKNHVDSENHRRGKIRNGFDRLTEVVPGTKGLARSESVVLRKTINHIKELMIERQKMIAFLESKGESVAPDLRASLEMLPEGFLEGELDIDKESGDESEEDVAADPDPKASPEMSPQNGHESEAEGSRSNSEGASEAQGSG